MDIKPGMTASIVEQICETKLLYLGQNMFGVLHRRPVSLILVPLIDLEDVQAARELHHGDKELFIVHVTSSEFNISNAQVVRNLQDFVAPTDTTMILPSTQTLFDPDYIPPSMEIKHEDDKDAKPVLGEIDMNIPGILPDHSPTCELNIHACRLMEETAEVKEEPPTTLPYIENYNSESDDSTIIMDSQEVTFRQDATSSEATATEPYSSPDVTAGPHSAHEPENTTSNISDYTLAPKNAAPNSQLSTVPCPNSTSFLNQMDHQNSLMTTTPETSLSVQDATPKPVSPISTASSHVAMLSSSQPDTTLTSMQDATLISLQDATLSSPQPGTTLPSMQDVTPVSLHDITSTGMQDVTANSNYVSPDSLLGESDSLVQSMRSSLTHESQVINITPIEMVNEDVLHDSVGLNVASNQEDDGEGVTCLQITNVHSITEDDMTGSNQAQEQSPSLHVTNNSSELIKHDTSENSVPSSGARKIIKQLGLSDSFYESNLSSYYPVLTSSQDDVNKISFVDIINTPWKLNLTNLSMEDVMDECRLLKASTPRSDHGQSLQVSSPVSSISADSVVKPADSPVDSDSDYKPNKKKTKTKQNKIRPGRKPSATRITAQKLINKHRASRPITRSATAADSTKDQPVKEQATAESIPTESTDATTNDSKQKPKLGLKITHHGLRKQPKQVKQHACQCDMCGEKFLNTTEFISHYKDTHPTLKCDTCDREFTNPLSLQKHKYNHVGKKLPCEDCGRTFPHESWLKDHRKTHFKVKPHPCPHPGCGAGFTHKYDLNKHSVVHENKEFVCEHCTYKTNDVRYLKQHNRKHTGETPYSCQNCGKLFAYSMQKSRHRCTQN